MKQLLITIATVVLVGCGESQQSTPAPEAKPAATAKAPKISIWRAAADGNIEVVKQHLSAGTNVDEKNLNDMTPLHHALEGGHKEIAELLIEKGVDVNAKDSYGMTPLYYAATWGYKEIAELLIEKGVDVNPKDEIGFTPLDVAEVGREDDSPEDKAVKKEIYDLLRKHGAKTSEELKAEQK
jgi:ankyrin repeat protein